MIKERVKLEPKISLVSRNIEMIKKTINFVLKDK